MKSKPFAGFWINEAGKIVIPTGNKKFSAIDYIGNYPIIWTKVVGVTARHHKEAIQNYVSNKEDLDDDDFGDEEDYTEFIEIVPEPTNKYDPHAHKVELEIRTYNDGKQPHYKDCIGYIPKEIAKLLTQIKRKFNITYTAKLDRIRSNMKNGTEMKFPCSAAVVLTPKATGPSMPLHRVIKTSSKFKNMKSFKEMLEETSTSSKKRRKAR